MSEESLKFRTHSETVDMVNVSDLIPYEGNPKKHGKNIDELCKAIEAHGWTMPLLIDQKKRIIAGHGRRQAAIRLGRTKVPCITVECGDAEYFEMMLEDNKLSAISKMDKKLHKEVLEVLQGLDAAIESIPGYDAEEIDKIFGLATKETIDATADFGDAGEVTGEIDPDARVVSMTFKFMAKDHASIKDKLTAIMKENDLETISEALLLAMSSFKGTTKTIRR